MKSLSIKQPWASLVAAGYKTIECRTWRTPYRGSLLICSSKGDVEINDGLIAPGGMALGVVELVDILPMTEQDLKTAFLPEDWHSEALRGLAWHVKKMYEIVPFAVKGRLNLFNVDTPLVPLPAGYKDHCIYLDAIRSKD